MVMKHAHFACAPLLAIVVLSGQVSGAIITTATFNGHTYHLLSNNNWTGSEAEAISLGGHLATINDQAENDFVFNTFSSFGGERRLLWIGLNDAAVEGTFVWSSGEQVSCTNWTTGEPTNQNNNEDYVHIWSPSFVGAGRWNDLSNVTSFTGQAFYGVVEILPQSAVPEPASLAIWGIGALACAVGTYRRRK